MSSDDDEMTDEFPRQDQDGWMSSDGDEVTDEFPLKIKTGGGALTTKR
jgi:hypothetical protein